MESLEMHKRRKCREVLVDGLLTWLFLVTISMSLWLADGFSGVGEPTTYWRVGCLFSLCCFYVLKYCSENSWVGCNECFQRPSFERGFFPALGGHHPFSCAVHDSLIVPTHKGPLCEPVSKCASRTRLNVVRYWSKPAEAPGFGPTNVGGYCPRPNTGLDRKTWDLSTMLWATLWTIYGEWAWGWSAVGAHTTDSEVMRWQRLSLRREIKLNWKTVPVYL